MADALALPEGYTLGSPGAAAAPSLPDGYVLGAPDPSERGHTPIKIDPTHSLDDMSRNMRARMEQHGNTIGNTLDALGTGINTTVAGVAALAGSPVDFVNAPLQMAGLMKPRPSMMGQIYDAVKGGMEKTHMLKYDSVDDLPERFRPVGRAGEVIGGTLPFAGLPLGVASGMTQAELAAARSLPEAGLGGAFRHVAAEAAADPSAHLAREAGMMAGAAQGSSAAEEMFPDNQTAQLIGQLGGAILQPTMSALKLGGGALGQGKSALFNKGGQLASDGNSIVRHIESTGGDAQATLDNLKPNPYGFSPSDSDPALAGLRQQRMKDDPIYAQQAQQADQQAQQRLAADIHGSVEPGDPNALTGAAQAADQGAQSAKYAATEKLTSADAGVQRGANNDASDLLDTAWQNGRNAENSLYKNVDKTQPVDNSTLRPLLKDLVENDPDVYGQVPVVVRDRLVKLAAEDANPTAGDIMGFRSNILRAKRTAQSGPNADANLARIYGKIGNGLLDPLASVPNLDEARAASAQFHDLWDRSFAGKSQQYAATGATQAPGQTLEAAWVGNPARRMQNLDDLMTATKPPSFAGADHPDLSPQMARNIEDFVRAQAGRLQPAALPRFARDYAPLLDKFPQLRQDVQGAIAAHQTDLEGTAFGRVLKAGEKPDVAVGKALTGPAPSADYGALAQLARAGGADAQAGLRAATMNHLKAVASNQDGTMNFAKLRDALLNPRGNSNQSLFDLMRNHNVITPQNEAQLRNLLDTGLKRDANVAAARLPTEPVGGLADDMAKTVIRAAGAHIAKPIGHFAGSPLLMASRGADLAEKYAARLPAGKAKDRIYAALDDPEKLRALLKAGLANGGGHAINPLSPLQDVAGGWGSNLGVTGPARLRPTVPGLLTDDTQNRRR